MPERCSWRENAVKKNAVEGALIKNRFSICLSLLWLALTAAAEPTVSLEEGFANPPEQTKPWCYWYWINGFVSKEGITKDLEAMKHVGIGEAFIGNISFGSKQGDAVVLSEPWWQMTEHAIREGGRIGVDIGIFNCPGWSMSGGPWIKPEQAMRYLATSELRVTGPQHFVGKLTVPKTPFQDVSVLAFPAPPLEKDTLAAHAARITVAPFVKDAARLIDGNPATAAALTQNENAKPVAVDLELGTPLTARSLTLCPGESPFSMDCELLAQDGQGKFQRVRSFRYEREKTTDTVGFMPNGPVTVGFPATTSSHFRLVCSGFTGKGAMELAEIQLSGAARLEFFVEKQLGKMHPTPLPEWDSYLWPAQPEPELASLAVPTAAVTNLSELMTADGTLTWQVPAGEWVIQRIGMTPTGVENNPASKEGTGLEVDKMSAKLVQEHFAAFVGQILKRMPAADRKALTRVVADSYEMGSQNWTDGLEKRFRQVFGYDPLLWLPVLSGRLVGSATQSERFLWDLRRLVADDIATEYVGGLRAVANANGLGLWLENYGHWGFPSEFLKYGSRSDRIGGEFWVDGALGSIECRAAASCANIYGMPFVSAESFTGGKPFVNAPGDLKARGDWSFCEGINHRVLHVYIHQPDGGRFPGMNKGFGSEFNRQNTWFERGKAFMDYTRRSGWLLQQGWRVADVAYFIGEDVPKMTGVRDPELSPGFDFDYINAEVIEKNLVVQEGRLVLPHGVSYRVLVLPKQATMRPELLKKIADLVKAGATVIGEPPTQSPSMTGFPACDEQVQKLSTELWGGTTVTASGEHSYGQGRVIWGKSLSEVFTATKIPADIAYRNASAESNFLFTHRRSAEADIYFVSNQKDEAQQADGVFRVTGRQPELWDAVTGERRTLPEWREQDSQTIVPLRFAPNQSWFVVFRQPGTPTVGKEKNFPALKTLATLTAPWEVAFDPQWGGPEHVVFPRLMDWTKHPEEGIKHYSGMATYRTTFELSESDLLATKAGLFLDLGDVRSLATVRLNGQELGTLWTPPWHVDIARAAKIGSNTLEVVIINTWNNRLAGDHKLPEEQRRTWLYEDSAWSQMSLNSEKLLPAGLLGPVTLQNEINKEDSE
jgi:hypothetical protein